MYLLQQLGVRKERARTMKLGCTESGKDRDESRAQILMTMQQRWLKQVGASCGNLTIKSENGHWKRVGQPCSMSSACVVPFDRLLPALNSAFWKGNSTMMSGGERGESEAD